MPSILSDFNKPIPSGDQLGRLSVLSQEPLREPEIDNTEDIANSRDFTDTAATRKNIYKNVLHQMGQIGPITNKRHTLELLNPQYVDPEDFSLADQKKAILSGKSLHRRIRGKWRLTDNATGNVLDEKEQTIAQVPYFSQRGTFIHNGTEYTNSNQMRLRPGVFTRIKENGEIESHVNTMPGNGIGHRYFLDPETGIFKINIGQAKLPLYPIMKALGVSDKELRQTWGDQLLADNMQAPDAKTVNKLYQRLIRKPNLDASEEEKSKSLSELFNNMKLDPEVTKRTLGRAHSNLTKEAILDTTKKLIRVSKQEDEPDDRDHLAYQSFYGPEDLMAERITRDKTYLRQLLWKASFKGNLSSLHPGALTKQLHHVLLHTGLGQAAEEINNAELLSAQGRVTRLGEGGIGSMDAIPDSSRNVNASQYLFIDPIITPESGRVGIDTRIASQARKGTNGRIYAPVRDIKTGQVVYKTPQEMADVVVAFPGELNSDKTHVAVMAQGKTKYVPREQVQFEAPHFESAFSPLGNMVPGKSGLKGQRMAMGARYLTQALPLINREAPLLQSGMPGQHMKRSFEDEYGKHLGAVFAKGDGVVKNITPDGITVQYADGTKQTHELYNRFPYARKTSTHNEALVKPGQQVNANTVLAKSNITDNNGTAALGLNAKIAFLPWHGLTYEDAIIMSQSMAKRMTSEHMYQHEQEWGERMKRGLKPFISLFPNEYDKRQLTSMDDHGVVKPGTVVKFGDPLVLTAEERERTHAQIHKGRKPTFTNKTLTWDHHGDGEVSDVVHTPKGVRVSIQAHMPVEVGDKVSNRWGGKGINSQIIPDDQMPHDENGEPFEMVFNPLGMISRINPIQVHELILGKIAKKTGIPYKLEDFSHIKDLTDFTKQEMQKHGVKDTETITDPTTGRQIPNVLTGQQYILKLHHTAASKGQGRSFGTYSAEDIPARGGEGGSKKLGMLDSSALLSSGATEFLRDSKLIRGQKNEKYWQAFMSGFRPPEPEVPLVYKKFVDSLKASGINVVRAGRQLHVMALTDKDIDQLAGDREIKNTDTVDWKEGLRPKKGGLFDPALTGGHGGSRMSFIKLDEPMPNPAFEEPIRRILGLTQKKLEGVLSGKEPVGTFGTGPQAIKDALENINLPKAIQQAELEAKSTKRGQRDEAVRKLRYLKDAERLHLHPKDWVWTKAPVLPPIYRPVSVMQGSGMQQVSDANYLYKELFDANDVLKQAKHAGLGDVGQERLTVYHALKGVTGLGDPITAKNQERQVKGVLEHTLGTGPKWSVMHRQLLGSTVDVVGRGVISPNPDFDMDQVGIPENKAWEVYKPFIIRRLVQHGVPRLEAARAFTDQTKLARDAMVTELKERPVVINRAPVLHRYGIMGAWPVLVKGDVMQLPPIVTKGFGADFDGDQSVSAVMVALPKHVYFNIISKGNKATKNFWRLRKMSAHFKAGVHYKKGFEYFAVNLEDFPHAVEYKQKAHIKFHGVEDNLYVFAYDENNHKSVLAAVSGWSEHLDREIITIELKSGRQIISDDDPRAVYGLDPATYDFKRYRPADAVGVFVPRIDRLPDTETELTSIPIQSKMRLMPKAKLNRQFGWLLGTLSGDGWVIHAHNTIKGVALAGIDDGILAAYKDALLETFVDEPKITIQDGNGSSYGQSRKITVSSKEFGEFIEPLIGTTAQHKHLPPFYMAGSKEFRLGLLAGLIDTDGSVCISRGKKTPQLMVNFSSVSLRLVQETQHLARSLGINTRITPSKTPAGNPAWMLNISTVDFKRADIQLKHLVKVEIYKNGPTPDAASPAALKNDIVPVPIPLAREMMKLLDCKDKQQYNLYTTAAKACKTQTMSRHSAKRILTMYRDQIKSPYLLRFTEIVSNTDVVWDVVTGYTETGIKETGYDLTVPGYETFMSIDGIILSNTMNYHVPVSEEARKEVIEKLMPSRNLISPGDFRATYLPSMEYQGGLYHATTAHNEKQRPVVFHTKKDAIKAYHEGRISLDTPVEVIEH